MEKAEFAKVVQEILKLHKQQSTSSIAHEIEMANQVKAFDPKLSELIMNHVHAINAVADYLKAKTELKEK